MMRRSGLSVKKFWLLGLVLVLAFGVGLFSCSSDGDDDDDGGDDDGSQRPCDADCLDISIDGGTDCWIQFVDCMDGGGSFEQCGNEAEDCVDDVWDDACECADKCNSCAEDWCDCMDACPEDDEACEDQCDDNLRECADWLDGDCADQCDANFETCTADCMAQQDWDACRGCMNDWNSCMHTCY